jgi:hypothetical protein
LDSKRISSHSLFANYWWRFKSWLASGAFFATAADNLSNSSIFTVDDVRLYNPGSV